MEKDGSSGQAPQGCSVPRTEIEGQLQLILASPQFAKSERMCRFLRFVVEHSLNGSTERLKEYSIGVEVFDKTPSFDPRTDTNVRTEARRLRTKLAEYYATAGNGDSVRIEMPIGSYAPMFVQAQPRAAEAMSEPTVAPAPGPSPRSKVIPLVAAASILLLAVAGLAWRFTTTAAAHKPRSIAVLPFLNLSNDEENEYFADGLTEEILNHLAKVPGLKVVARTSSFQFKGHNEDVRSIGKRLNVDAVLEGSVRRIGKRLRITPQLIASADGFHLWSETIERDDDNLFALQDEISRLVVKALGAAPVSATSKPPNPEAYRASLRALHHFNKFSVADFKSSMSFAEQAIALDPNYAPAYVRLASAHGILGFWGAEPQDEAVNKSLSAVQKAIDLDPNLAEAYHVRACIKATTIRDLDGAGKDFDKAQSLSQGHEQSLNDYAVLYLLPLKRLDEALKQSRKAVDLDPLNIRANRDLATVLYFRRDYDAAISQLRQTLDLFPNDRPATLQLFQCLLMKGMFDEARRIVDTPDKSRAPAEFALNMGMIEARSGNKVEGRKLLQQVLDFCSRRCRVTPIQIARLQSELGDLEGAFLSLDKGYEPMLQVNPVYDPLRSDARYQSLIVKMRLTP